MNIALPAILITLFLLPGFVFARAVFVVGGNPTTESLFSKEGGLALIVSPFLHGIVIYLNNQTLERLFSSQLLIDPYIFFELATGSEDVFATGRAIFPHVFEIGIYFFIVTLLAILLGKTIQKGREKLLHKVILRSYLHVRSKGQESWIYNFLYSWLRYDLDWFNYFSGYHDPTPTFYPANEKNVTKKVKFERMVSAWFDVRKGYCNKKYFATIIDYTLDKNKDLVSVMVLPLKIIEKRKDAEDKVIIFDEKYPALPLILDKSEIEDILINVVDYTSLDKKEDEKKAKEKEGSKPL